MSTPQSSHTLWEVRVRFVIIEFSLEAWFPDAITAAIGVQPTQTYRTGDIIPKTYVPQKSCGWVLETQTFANMDPQIPLMSLIDQLRPAKEYIANYQAFSKRFLVLIDEGESTGPLFFDAELISEVASLKAALGIDIV